MTVEQQVTLIIQIVQSFMANMVPIIAVLAGIIFMITWFMSITIGLGRKTFRG